MADSRLTQLGPYQILDQIAQGAYGEVLRARHVGPAGFQRILAIKRLRPHVLADASAVRAFENEARIGGLLLHHNIAQTLEFRQDQGLYYLVMEYVDGISFQDIILNHRQLGRAIPFEVVIELVGQACDGLHHAHEAQGTDGHPLKLVHRDIKPSNLMLTRTGVVKVMDFGIARVENQNLTDAGFIKGTPRYLSPEMITRNTVLDRRSDLFSLAAVLYELLALKPLFDAPNLLNLMARVRDADVGAQLQELASSRASFARVLSRCLTQVPSARFQTARELAREVRSLKRELSCEDPDLEAYAQVQMQWLANRAVRKTVQAGGASARPALSAQTGPAQPGVAFDVAGGGMAVSRDPHHEAETGSSSRPANTAKLLAQVDALAGLAESREMPGTHMPAAAAHVPAGEVQSLLGPGPVTPEMFGGGSSHPANTSAQEVQRPLGAGSAPGSGAEKQVAGMAASSRVRSDTFEQRSDRNVAAFAPPIAQTVQMVRNPPAANAQAKQPVSASALPSQAAHSDANQPGTGSGQRVAPQVGTARPPSGGVGAALLGTHAPPSPPSASGGFAVDDDDDDSIQTITGLESPARSSVGASSLPSVGGMPSQSPWPTPSAPPVSVVEQEVELQVEEEGGSMASLHPAFSADDWGDDEKSRVMTHEELERLKAGTTDSELSEAMLRTLSDVPLPNGSFSVRGPEVLSSGSRSQVPAAMAGGGMAGASRPSWRSGMAAPPVDAQDTTQPSITDRVGSAAGGSSARRDGEPVQPMASASPLDLGNTTAPRAFSNQVFPVEPSGVTVPRGARGGGSAVTSSATLQLPPPLPSTSHVEDPQLRTRLVSAIPGGPGMAKGAGVPELPPALEAGDTSPVLETKLFVPSDAPLPKEAPLGIRSTALVTGPKESESTTTAPVVRQQTPISRFLQPGKILVHSADKDASGGFHPLLILGLGLAVVGFILYLLSQL